MFWYKKAVSTFPLAIITEFFVCAPSQTNGYYCILTMRIYYAGENESLGRRQRSVLNVLNFSPFSQDTNWVKIYYIICWIHSLSTLQTLDYYHYIHFMKHLSFSKRCATCRHFPQANCGCTKLSSRTPTKHIDSNDKLFVVTMQNKINEKLFRPLFHITHTEVVSKY